MSKKADNICEEKVEHKCVSNKIMMF